jgi:hypothetical protein
VGAPGWFGFGMVLIAGTVVALKGRRFLALWRRYKADPGSIDDEWDPFK